MMEVRITSTVQIIIGLLQETGKMQKELTDYLGITKNAFTDWKSGRIKSYQKHLPKIAEFFGVSVDYLLGLPQTDYSFNAKEKSLIDLIHKSSLTDEQINVIATIIKSWNG